MQAAREEKSAVADLKGAYLRAHEVCTSDQIVDLLRRYKHVSSVTEEEIRLSGSKVELIQNLRRAVSKGLLPERAVRVLVRDAEENGDQHIFYYKPASQTARRRIRAVVGHLQESDGHTFARKPIYGFPKKGLRWVDFRTDIGNKPDDWLLKAYMSDSKLEKVDERDPREGGLDLVVSYRRQPIDVVLVIRWNEPDLLELRVSSDGLTGVSKKKKRLTLLLKEFQELTSIGAGQLDEWSLTSATTRLMQADKTNADITIGESSLVTQGGRKFHASGVQDDESIYDDPDAAAAIRQLLKKQSTAESTTVRWELPRHLSGYKRSVALSVKVGGRFTNEISIGPKVDPGVVDYVTSKLREADEDDIQELDRSDWATSVFSDAEPWKAVQQFGEDQASDNPAFGTIARWMSRNKSRRIVSLSELARSKKSLSPGDLLGAIYSLQKAGLFRRRIGVFDPHGIVIEELDPGIDSLPSKVSSKDKNVQYKTEDLRIAEVYQYG